MIIFVIKVIHLVRLELHILHKLYFETMSLNQLSLIC